jgi:hypothetical protein
MKLLAILFCVWALWRLYGYLKANPEALSLDALSKSLLTLGFLALLLIAIVGLAVLLLR